MGTRISDAIVAGSIAGTEKIPISGASTPAITPDLLKEFLGTWTDYVPTFTGHSLDPTITFAKYCKIGNLCFVSVLLAGTATSNATTFTMTVPFNAAVTGISTFNSPVDNGSSLAPGHITITAGSNIANLYKAAFVAWTASGTKRGAMSFFYITE